MTHYVTPTQKTPSFVMLAPMEGIIDHTMRNMFSAIGGLDRCVTEFIRITSQTLPERVYKRYYPEIINGGATHNKTTVYAQLLGDNPITMSNNAAKLCQLGASGIDINFGCPAKVVNSNGGGSVLLKDPNNLYRITHAIRQAVPTHIPVSAKMRLGFTDKSLALENAQAIEDAGANEVGIHARTKVEAYKPPAYWDAIGRINQQLNIPVTANGEMWNVQDIQRCMSESGTDRIMLGRGLVACPDLALFCKGQTQTSLHWGDICLLLLHYKLQLNACCDERYINSLIKQWLAYLREQYAEAHLFFQHIKRIKQSDLMQVAIIEELNKQRERKDVSGMIGRLDLSTLLNNYQ